MIRKLFSVLITVVIISLVFTGAWAATARTAPSVDMPDGQETKSVPPHPQTQTTVDGALAEDFLLGEPGTSFRYVNTIGITSEPYPADTGHLNTPHGLYIDGEDNLFVTEIWAHRVVEYDASGNGLLTLGKVGSPWHHDNFLSSPRDTVVDADGNIWVAYTQALKQYDPDGNMLQIFPADDPWQNGSDDGHFNDPNGVAFDSSGLLYVADSLNHRIQVFDLSIGTPVYVETIGITGVPLSDNTGFDQPQRVAFDSLGRLYVLDENNNRVQRCTKNLEWSCETFFGVTDEYGSDTDHLGWAFGLTVHSNDLYIVDSSNARVLKCDLLGNCTNFAGEPEIRGSDNSHFEWPTDVAVDSTSKVYVADETNHRVQIFDSTGNFLGTRGVTLVPYLTDEVRVNTPWGITIANDGGLLVTENSGHRVIKYDVNLNQVWAHGISGVTIGDDAYSDLSGNPAQDNAGNIYFPDIWNHQVVILTPEGDYLDAMGVKWEAGDDNAHFDCPRGVAISPVNHYIYVVDSCNQRIQVFDQDRYYVATLGVTDETGTDNLHFDNPGGVAIDTWGNIYVADTWNFRIQKCTLAGTAYSCSTFAGETGVFDDAFNHFFPQSVTVEQKGNVYVGDEWNQRVQVYDKNGAYLTTIGGSWGWGDGQFVNPLGIAVDTHGNVYVTDTNNHRIQVFAPGYPGWKQVNINGYGDRLQTMVSTLAVYNGQLYGGTWPAADQAAQVWRTSDGKHWTEFSPPWDAGVTGGSAVFSGKLYLGIGTELHGEIWRTDGSTWEQVVAEGFGDPNVYWVNALEVFSGYLYATTSDDDGNLQIYRSDTGDLNDWDPVDQNALGGDYTTWQDSVLGVFDNHLYLGLTRDGVAELWRTSNGLDWDAIFTDGLAPNNTSVGAIEEFNGDLYLGLRNVVEGGEIWRSSDGLTFNQVATEGLGNSANTRPYGLEVYNGTLFVSFTNYDTGAEIWMSNDGSHWIQSVNQGWGDSNNITATYFDKGIAVFNKSLYFATSNSANAGEVWQFQHALRLPMVLKNYTSSPPSTWKTIPSPTSNTLHALDMVSTNDGWAVGEQGTIFRWNGSTWTVGTSPVTANLTGIDLLDASTGWAVGNSGVILSWNGSTWSSVTSPTSATLEDVHILAANDAWAVGEGGTIIHWNGVAWSTTSSPTTYDLFAMDFVSPTDGWAVGGEWNTGISWYEAAYLHWNGSTWTNYTPVMVLDLLFDVDLVSSSYGIAVGSNNAKSFWNGTSWNSRYTTPMMHYQGIDFLAVNDGWAVGWEFSGKNIQHWDGSAWTQVSCPTTNRLNDVFMLSTTQGWAVGDNGIIISYGP